MRSARQSRTIAFGPCSTRRCQRSGSSVRSQASEVAVTFQAGSSPARYWVAVYSVQLWCTGDYSLKLVCKGVPSSCGATGGRCVPFAKGCAAGEVAGAPLGCAGAPGKLCCKPPVFLRALKASYRAQLEQPLEEALGASAEAMRSRLDPVEALLTNNLGEAIFVSLASDLGLEEQTPSGWQATPAGKSIYPQRDLALAPGESAVVLPSPALAPTPGAWRLALTYRRGCAAGQPVSDDSCAAIASATSAAFTAKVCPAATPPDLAACPHRELRTVFAADGVFDDAFRGRMRVSEDAVKLPDGFDPRLRPPRSYARVLMYESRGFVAEPDPVYTEIVRARPSPY